MLTNAPLKFLQFGSLDMFAADRLRPGPERLGCHLRIDPCLVDVDRIGNCGRSELLLDAEDRGSNLFESVIADRFLPVLGCVEGWA
ncbi:hypothetical protein D9M72_582040 [compost metagenome]